MYIQNGGFRDDDRCVRTWLNVNGAFKAWNAVAFNGRGRWRIDEPSRRSKAWHKYVPGTSDSAPFDLIGPEPIP